MTDNRRIINWTAILSILALVAHAIDAPDHLTEWWGYGTFFVIIAAFQFFYGLALFLRPWRYDEDGNTRPDADRYGRPYFILGTILTASVIMVYIVTRTTGIPFFGPDAVVEPMTPLSLVPPLECLPLLYCHVLLLSRTRVPSREHTPAT
jgi:peptidoglycan/LPS O-acetylase OafA/YrhL